MHVRDFRVSGGETLIHPALPDILRVARDSGIADQVTLLTNGLLLDRMPEALWRGVDRIQISLYPASEGRVDLKSAQQRAREANTELWVHRPLFREPAADLPAKDGALVRKIFATCLFRRACRTVRDGRLYPCPQSAWAHERYPQAGAADPVNAADGLLLEDRPDMAERIRAHLARQEPLGSCARCLGIVGRCIGHSQLPIEQARRAEPRCVEDLLDEEELATRLRRMRLNRRFRLVPRRLRRWLGLFPTSRPLMADVDPAESKQRLWPPAARSNGRVGG
jgi:hypothetical protein